MKAKQNYTKVMKAKKLKLKNTKRSKEKQIKTNPYESDSK